MNWHYLRRTIAARREWRGREQADCQLIERSGLFDRAWYLAQYPEIARSPLDPILDYVRRGAREGRNPNPLFEGDWYLAQYPDAQATGLNPLIHYLLHGAAEGREPGPFFDTQWYVAQHPELNSRLRAIERKAFPGSLALVHPSEGAAAETSAEVASRRIDASCGSVNPLAHYLHDGWHKGVLPFDPARLLAGMKIAVIVHLFYADLWGEIAGWLRNIPIDFDLFVSVPRENAPALRALVLRDHPRAQVLAAPNAGRDVGAFFAVLPHVLAGNYSTLCKLHSKKGLEYPDAWRDLLLRGLLANKLLVTRVLHAFACEPELTLVGAREVYLSAITQMTQNRDKVEEITRLLHPGRSIPGNWGFFAGTMFWARPDFFRPFAQCGDRILSFEDDNTRNDGQLAHALERMFGALAALQEKRIGLTEITNLGGLDGTIHIMQAPGEPWAGNFVRILREHALTLNGDLPFTRKLGPLGRAKPAKSMRARMLVLWQPRLMVRHAGLHGPTGNHAGPSPARSRTKLFCHRGGSDQGLGALRSCPASSFCLDLPHSGPHGDAYVPITLVGFLCLGALCPRHCSGRPVQPACAIYFGCRAGSRPNPCGDHRRHGRPSGRRSDLGHRSRQHRICGTQRRRADSRGSKGARSSRPHRFPGPGRHA